jgi:hypothetical protein
MTTYETDTESEFKDIQLSYQLIGMELVDFEIRSKREIKDGLINFQIEINHKISQEGIVEVNAKINILSESESLSSTNIICTFLIANYKEWLEWKNFENGTLPTEFTILINGITISTLRGVMFTKLQDTFLESAILPVINLQEFQNS